MSDFIDLNSEEYTIKTDSNGEFTANRRGDSHSVAFTNLFRNIRDNDGHVLIMTHPTSYRWDEDVDLFIFRNK